MKLFVARDAQKLIPGRALAGGPVGEAPGRGPLCTVLVLRCLPNQIGMFTMALQSRAQSRQSEAQCAICSSPAMVSQSLAQASHSCAQALQIAPCCGDLRISELAVIWHISAQSSSSAKCVGATWALPFSEQYRAVSKHIRCDLMQISMQLSRVIGPCPMPGIPIPGMPGA